MKKSEAENVLNEKVAYHRNGVGGEGFYVVEFETPDEEDPSVRHQMIATVFSDRERVAVLHRSDPCGLPMRGADYFGEELRAAIKRYNRRRDAKYRRLYKTLKTVAKEA